MGSNASFLRRKPLLHASTGFMTRHIPFCSFSFLWILLASAAFGQVTSADREKLRKEIDLATGQLDPGRLPRPDLASAKVRQRIDELGPFLSRVTDSANRDAWLRFLDLNPLTEAIESDASAADLMKESIAVRERLIGTTPGLEMSAVLKLRDAVDDLIDSLLFRNPEQSILMLKAQLESLAEMVEQVDESPSPDQFSAISARVALLDSSRQTPALVRQFQDTFDRPNAAILVGSSVVGQAINRHVARERPVRDCILGTRLIGDAFLQGDVAARLLPSTGTARIQLDFFGTVHSNNRGYNGPVQLTTVGDGEVRATQTMTVDASGVSFGETSSQATLSTRIVCIQHRLAIVRAIARKQAAKKKPAADRIALEKLRRQVADQFASESTKVSPVTPTELLARAEPMLNRLSLTKPTQNWSSTEHAITIDSVFRAPDQLASVVPRPDVPVPFALAMQLHESAIENAFSVMLAGRSLNERRLNELLEKVGQNKPAADEQDSDPPFEISFSRSRPVIFEAREKSLKIGLRGTRFAQGERAPLVKAMEITANYQPLTTVDGGTVLRRVGDVGVDFPRERLTLREVGLKPIIQKAFSGVFPEQILDQPIRISDDAKIESLRGREFQPSRVDIADGWLTIAFQ